MVVLFQSQFKNFLSTDRFAFSQVSKAGNLLVIMSDHEHDSILFSMSCDYFEPHVPKECISNGFVSGVW